MSRNATCVVTCIANVTVNGRTVVRWRFVFSEITIDSVTTDRRPFYNKLINTAGIWTCNMSIYLSITTYYILQKISINATYQPKKLDILYRISNFFDVSYSDNYPQEVNLSRLIMMDHRLRAASLPRHCMGFPFSCKKGQKSRNWKTF